MPFSSSITLYIFTFTFIQKTVTHGNKRECIPAYLSLFSACPRPRPRNLSPLYSLSATYAPTPPHPSFACFLVVGGCETKTPFDQEIKNLYLPLIASPLLSQQIFEIRMYGLCPALRHSSFPWSEKAGLLFIFDSIDTLSYIRRNSFFFF